MKITDKSRLVSRIITGVLLLFSCFYMYDFYKSLSGFIANGFREPLVMLPMILAFFLPVLCFLFFFYDFYVARINRNVKTAYSVFVSIYAIAVLILIFLRFDLYVSNNSFGAYDSLPSIIFHFPYDMIIISAVMLAWQLFNLVSASKDGSRAYEALKKRKEHGSVRVGIVEYIALSVLAVPVFIFTGAGIYAVFSAYENAAYDLKYVFMLIWVAVIPMANLVLLTLKPEKADIGKSKKLMFLSFGIAANLIFGSLFLIFESVSPSFLVGIGKPLFLIAFSVSLPIEPAIIFAIMAISTLILSVRLTSVIKKGR